MREQTGDLFGVGRVADLLVITTNGAVRQDGKAVMGRGVAKQAATRWPNLPGLLGDALQQSGNHVADLWKPSCWPTIVSFPVKHHWREPADVELIERSVGELVELTGRLGARLVVLPRPGCGNGGLDWVSVSVHDVQVGSTFELLGVRDMLVDRLDNRFMVVCNDGCGGQHD